MPTTYLSGQRTPALDRLASHHMNELDSNWVGLIVTPLTKDYLRTETIRNYPSVGIDNGCFSSAGRARYSWPEYERIIKLALFQAHDMRGGVLFATARDMPFNWQETLRLSMPVLPRIRALGVPAALVLQNGATPDNVPWDQCDVIFLGGGPLQNNRSMEWKVSPEAEACVAEARRRGKTVHMGRVNSHHRLSIASEWGVHSADGTYILAEMNKQRPLAYRKAAQGNPDAQAFVAFAEQQLDAAIARRRPYIERYVAQDNPRAAGRQLADKVEAQVVREREQRRQEVYEQAASRFRWPGAKGWLHEAESHLQELISGHITDWTDRIASRERKRIAADFSREHGAPIGKAEIGELERYGVMPRGFDYPEDDPLDYDDDDNVILPAGPGRGGPRPS